MVWTRPEDEGTPMAEEGPGIDSFFPNAERHNLSNLLSLTEYERTVWKR